MVGGRQWEEDVRGRHPFHPTMPRVLLSQGLITEAGELGCLVEHSELFGRVTVTPTATGVEALTLPVSS